MKRIVLTGGGTAGHVTPNIALLPALRSAGYEISYIGSMEGIEKKLIEAQGIPYYGIASGKLRRYKKFHRSIPCSERIRPGIQTYEDLKAGCRFLQRRFCISSRSDGCQTPAHPGHLP